MRSDVSRSVSNEVKVGRASNDTFAMVCGVNAQWYGALDNSHGICFSFSNFALLIKKNSPLGRGDSVLWWALVRWWRWKHLPRNSFNENKRPISCYIWAKGATVWLYIRTHLVTLYNVQASRVLSLACDAAYPELILSCPLLKKIAIYNEVMWLQVPKTYFNLSD